MRFPSKLETLLRSAIRSYPDEAGASHWRKELKLLKRLPDKRHFTRRDVVAVVKWKVTAFTPRVVQYVEKNDNASVRDATKEAFLCTRPAEAIHTLTRNLDGVQVPVASAILMFQAPNRHTVIDRNAWGVLHDLNALGRRPPKFLPSHYEDYLAVCRKLADIYRIRLRSLDRGLWVLGTKDWRTRLRAIISRKA